MSIEQLSRTPSAPADLPAPRRAPRSAGRVAELAALVAAVAERGPGTTAVLVEGEAGMGTSTLLALAREEAARQDWAVLAGCAAGPGGGAPLSPFFDAFGPTPLLEVLRPAESWLGRGAGPGDSPSRLQELYSRVRAALAAASGRSGTVLALDDVHWADPASVDLLVALLRHPPAAPLLLLLGCRADRVPVPLERALGAAVRLRLGPLGDEAVRLLLPTATARHRAALLAASTGNPRYLHALAGLPAAALDGPPCPGSGSERVDAAVIGELRALPALAHVVVGAAALLGDDIDPEAVAVVSGADVDAVAGVLDELVALDVLREVGGRIRFRHPLVRAAAERMTRPAWRVAAHRRIDAWLAGLGAPPLARAPHVDAAARLGDRAAADLLAAAAREVLTARPATAARWLATALRIRPDADRPAGGGPPGCALLLARALLLAGGPDAAARAAAGVPAGPDRAGATLLLARVHEARGAFREAQAVLRAGLGPGHPARQVEQAVELDALEIAQGVAHRAVRAAPHAPAAPPTPGADAARAVVLAGSVLVAGPGAREQRLVEAAARAVDAVADTDLDVVLHHLPLLVAAEHDAAPADALRHAERGLAVAARAGCPEEAPGLRLAAAAVALDHGPLALAARLAEDALDGATDLGRDPAAAVATTLRAACAAWRDGPAAAAELLGEDPGPYSRAGSWWHAVAAAAHAEALLAAGRADEAGRVCRAAAAGPAARPRLWALAAHAALGAGDPAAAREAADRAQRALPAAARCGTSAAQVHAAHARVALARHDVTRAVAAARAAVAAVDGRDGEPGAPGVPAARAGLVLAEALAAAGDAAGAERRAGDAVERLEAAGATALARRAAEDARRRREPAPSDGLSRREREIALLVSEGLTNRAVAERLVLSVRTVDSHVARILAKLGVSSRLGVVRAMAGRDGNVGGRHA